MYPRGINYLISKTANVFSEPKLPSRGKTLGEPGQAHQFAEARPQSATGHPGVRPWPESGHHDCVKRMGQWEAGMEATVTVSEKSGNWHKIQYKESFQQLPC